MGSEFLTDPAPPSQKTYTDIFYEVVPNYLVYGMTWEQFWYDDPLIAKAYREAYELKQKQENYSAWLQGAYIYDALCAVSPVMRAFAKGGTRPAPYVKKPYGMDDAEEEYDRQRTETLNRFENIRSRINKNIKRKADSNGTDRNS